MSKVTVNFSKSIGTIKPVNGVGQPPFSGMDFSMCDYLKEAHVPFSRLHDVGGCYGRGVFVDIPNLFRVFDADPTDPENYDFAFTDRLITALVERGIEPFFRLGVTIENYRYIKAYRIYPPKDNLQWARICEGVIRHYTEGWADGFTYDIRYWEIWNEPDNYKCPMQNQMWRGTKEQYFALYEAASKHLKTTFPHLKIGGYASCGFYAHNKENVTEDDRYYIEFFADFLAYIRAHDCPLDFFSWHSYSTIEDVVSQAAYARRKLDEAGYTHTEHTLNEWNSCPTLKGTYKHAALTAGMLLSLQNTSLDSAMFYDARYGIGAYAGLFNSMTAKPLPAYYAFVAFGDLYVRGTQVAVSDLPAGVYGVAAKEEDGCLVLANTGDEPVSLSIEASGAGAVTACKLVAEGVLWEDTVYDGTLPPASILYIRYNL